MKLIYEFVQLFSEDFIEFDKLDKKETLKEANISVNYNNFTIPSEENFSKIILEICKILGNDSFELTFKVIDSKLNNFDISPDVSCTLKSQNMDLMIINDLFSQINNSEFDKIDKQEFIRIEIFIKKPLEIKNIHRIYFFEHFFKYLSSLSLKQLLINIFPNLIDENIRRQTFLIDEDIQEFNSNNFYFVHNQEEVENKKNNEIDDHNILSNYKMNCHFINSNLTVTPFSFFLEKKSNYETVNSFFENLLSIISIMYISNYTELINDNKFKVHINGYKLINEYVCYDFHTKYTNIFFQVFEWVYDNKKVSDKLELARNIITLDFHDGFEDINRNTLASIKSNYSIYLKKNVEKYIELKTRITDNILNLSIKSKEIITNFSSNFKNAFVGNLSFIFAVLIINIINNGAQTVNKANNNSATISIFNSDLTILYIMTMAISLIYLIFSYISTKKDLEHYNSTFNDLKESYSGLMAEDDLNNTFNNKILINDKEYIVDTVRIYSMLWGGTILISLIALYFLSIPFETFVDSNIDTVQQVFSTQN